jgi:ribosomal protein S21
MKAFRTLVQRERVLSIYKEKQYYEKPSDRKRRKKNEYKRKIMELANAKLIKQKKKKDKDKSKENKELLTEENNYV